MAQRPAIHCGAEGCCEGDRYPQCVDAFPARIMLGADPAVVIPSCWDDDAAFRYVTPTTD